MVLSVGRLELSRLWRTTKILHTAHHRRTSHPNLNQAGTLRLLRSTAVLTIIGRLLSFRLQSMANRLWMLVLPLVVIGFLLWLQTYIRTANKDGRHLTGLDGLFLGLAALAAAVPGISLVGAVLSVASMRGTQRQYAVRFTWILLSISLATAVIMDLLLAIRSGVSFTASGMLQAALCGAAAAFGSWLSIHFIRSRTRSGAGGIAGFCFYNWGMALFCLALFLLV
jgi:undecaprenyl pyrophosphate phosphatase UppP